MPRLWSQRITIITGGYGSGKTEVAINLALAKRRELPQTTTVSLIDLDIVNPYFRSRDKKTELEQRNIKIIAPEGKLRTADLPALPPAIGGAIVDPQQHVIIDVGGDPAGATALGRYSHDLEQNSYDLFLVANPHRPHTRTPEEIIEMMRLIEAKSRLRATGLCNNSNLMEYTVPQDLVSGQNVIDQVTKETGVPTVFVSCVPNIQAEVQKLIPNLPVLPLLLTMRPPWKQSDKI